jgi:2-amino-1-hydroxyethylphosphonate dioxygenase (glycine-forming)
MEVFDLYNKYGNNGYIGENVTQLEHATQCAFLAEEFCYTNICPYQDDLIIGSFLHDIGHLLIFDNKNNLETMGNYGVMNHEELGYKYLKDNGYNSNICDFARNHINTKRYLITKNVEYYDKLSDASKKTFEYQGGNLSANEMREFENNKLFKYHLKIREFDDNAKSTDKQLLQKIKDLNPVKYYYDLYKNTLD